MPHIFVSYRRADSQAISGRIYDRLVQAFGENNVFKDVDRIPPGSSFSDVLDAELKHCQVLLVVIGKLWLDIRDEDGNRRLDSPTDFVRMEIYKGLQRQGMLVIPVIVDGAEVPEAESLPDVLKDLPSRQVVQIRHDPDFHRDMDRLNTFLSALDTHGDSVRSQERKTARRNLYILGAFLALLVVAATYLISTGRIQVGVEPTLNYESIAKTLVAQTQVAALATATPNQTALIGVIMTSFVTQTQAAQETMNAAAIPTQLATATLTATRTPTPTANFTLTAEVQQTETQAAQAQLDAKATNEALATSQLVTNTALPTATPTVTSTLTSSPTVTPMPTATITATSSPLPNATVIVDVQMTQTAAVMQALQNAQATLSAQSTIAAHIDNANNYSSGQDYTSAINEYNSVIQIDSNNADAYLGRGLAYLKQGKPDEALMDFDKAIAADPNLALAYYYRGTIDTTQANTDTAIADFSKAIELNPQLARAYYNRAQLNKAKGEDVTADLSLYQQYRCAATPITNGTAGTRKGPGTTFERDISLERGTRVSIIDEQQESDGQQNRWYKLDYPGHDGDLWILGDLVSLSGDCGDFSLIAPDLYPAPLKSGTYWWVRGLNMPPNMNSSLSQHDGWDLSAATGEPIYSGPKGGLVVDVGVCTKCTPDKPSASMQGYSLGDPSIFADPGWNYGYGNDVIVKYANADLPASTRSALIGKGLGGGDIYCMYAHLSTITVTQNQKLEADTQIGTLGNTGVSEAPNLHLECRVSQSPNFVSWAVIRSGLIDPGLLYNR